MKKIIRSAAFILVLVLLLGVAVSCARNISENEDVGILSWFEGVLPGLSEVDDASGDEPSGGGSSGSSGGTAPASTTAATAEPEAPPTPSNFWNTSLKRYTLEGYNAYPASTVSDEWFIPGAQGDDTFYMTLNGNDCLFAPGHNLLYGVFGFGSDTLCWDFVHGDPDTVGISFILDPSTCGDLYASLVAWLCDDVEDYHPGATAQYPLFKVEDGELYFADYSQETAFYWIDMDEDDPRDDLSTVHYGSGTSSSCRVLILAGISGFTIYVNDQVVGYVLPSSPLRNDPHYTVYSIYSLLYLSFNNSRSNATFESVCFYTK